MMSSDVLGNKSGDLGEGWARYNHFCETQQPEQLELSFSLVPASFHATIKIKNMCENK